MDIMSMDWGMVMENFFGKMITFMKENGEITIYMEKVNISYIKEFIIKEIGLTIYVMEKDNKWKLMEIVFREISTIIWNMEKDYKLI